MGQIVVRGVETGVELASLKRGYASTIKWLGYSADGTRFASAAGYNARVFDARTARELIQLTNGGATPVYAGAWSLAGLTLTLGTGDGALWRVDAESGRVLGVVESSGDVRALALEGETTWAGYRDSVVRAWGAGAWGRSVDPGVEITRRRPSGAPLPPTPLEVCPAPRSDPDGEPLPPCATARLGTLRWRQPEAISREAAGLVFSADGALIASPSGDFVTVLDAATGERRALLRSGMVGANLVAFSHDNAHLMAVP